MIGGAFANIRPTVVPDGAPIGVCSYTTEYPHNIFNVCGVAVYMVSLAFLFYLFFTKTNANLPESHEKNELSSQTRLTFGITFVSVLITEGAYAAVYLCNDAEHEIADLVCNLNVTSIISSLDIFVNAMGLLLTSPWFFRKMDTLCCLPICRAACCNWCCCCCRYIRQVRTSRCHRQGGRVEAYMNQSHLQDGDHLHSDVFDQMQQSRITDSESSYGDLDDSKSRSESSLEATIPPRGTTSVSLGEPLIDNQ